MDRRSFLKSAPLIAAAAGPVPALLARAAEKVKPRGDTILVVVEMTGGNDGLNTVIPQADPLYYKNRPTLAVPKGKAIKITADVGLNPSLRGLSRLLERGELATVLGVGYPSPNRSHFDSMDIWQSADPRRASRSGWIGRALPGLKAAEGGLPAIQVAPGGLPLALQEAPGVASLSDPASFTLRFTGDPDRAARRKKLMSALSAPAGTKDDLADFVRRRQSQVINVVDLVAKTLAGGEDGTEKGLPPRFRRPDLRAVGESSLADQLNLVARLIKAEAGARIYYAAADGYDTHAGQAETHPGLLNDLGSAVGQLFETLRAAKVAERVVLLTYSEFGRRVQENGAKGTDHGAASHIFVAGPAVKGGLVGKYPRLDDLDDGDMKFAIDFRRVYTTLLSGWLGCDTKGVIDGTFGRLPLLAKA